MDSLKGDLSFVLRHYLGMVEYFDLFLVRGPLSRGKLAAWTCGKGHGWPGWWLRMTSSLSMERVVWLAGGDKNRGFERY